MWHQHLLIIIRICITEDAWCEQVFNPVLNFPTGLRKYLIDSFVFLVCYKPHVIFLLTFSSFDFEKVQMLFSRDLPMYMCNIC